MTDPSGNAPTLHEAFEQQVRRTPRRTAVVSGAAAVTYSQANARANRIAHALIAAGVREHDGVGILLERSADWVCAFIGILKTGAAYVPLDVAWPAARIRAVIGDARLTAIVTSQRWQSLADGLEVERLVIERVTERSNRRAEKNPRRTVDPRAIAYVIYTSGSTGTPKGVMIEHRSVLNLIEALRESVYGDRPRAGLRIGVNGSFAFDTSVKQLVQICLGHTLVIVPEAVRLDPQAMTACCRAQAIDVIDCTPSQLLHWRRAPGFTTGCPRVVLVGGEAIPEQLWRDLGADRGRTFFNLYGPTECTVDAAVCRVTPDRATPRIGVPIRAADIVILDERMDPVAAGIAGELYVSGVGLARGYLHRPARTAERFVPNPFASGTRLYRTGDRGRRLPDGEIEFLGRTDEQVKVRGFRIELAEIEIALARDPGVSRAVVTVCEDASGERRLVAYVVPRGPMSSPDERQRGVALRDRVATELPDYMVPSAIVWMHELPLTTNGKVDRGALPAPTFEGSETSTLPRTPVEAALAAIWCDVLGHARVGVDDSFFALGGHSLLVAQVAARIRETLAREVPIGALFEHDTIAKLARHLDETVGETSSDAPAFTPVPRDAPGPVSFAQERVWFLQQLAPANLAYVFRTIIRCAGPLVVAALEHALTELVRRHESLRTTFVSVDGRPRQLVGAPWTVTLPVRDLSGDPARAIALERLCDEQFRTGFDLSTGPLIRWELVRLAEDEHALIHVEHHLIHDGWSLNVFLADLRELYAAFIEGRPAALAAPPIGFVDFCAWQRAWIHSADAARQLTYWKTRLAGAPALLDLPLDRPRPSVQRFRGAIERIELAPALADALREASRREHTTLFMTMIGAFFVLMNRLSGQEDVCLGTGVANRRRRETESLIGMIINTLVLRVGLDGDPTLRGVLQRVHQTTVEAYTHQDAPFDAVVDAVQPSRDASQNPLFQVAFSFHDAPLPALTVGDLSIGVDHLLDNGSAKFDMNLVVIPRLEQRRAADRRNDAEGISIIWEYNTDLFEAASIRRMADLYRRALDAIVDTPALKLSELRLVSDDEQRQLDSWNATAAPQPRVCIHWLFASHAAAAPDALAILTRDERLTYAALDDRSNRLAHDLRRRGVRPGSIVAVYMTRSAGLATALLAVLKAGAAYLPIDPDIPEARLVTITSDAAVALILGDAFTAWKASACAAPVVDLDAEPLDADEAGQDGPLGSDVALDDVAYVIYTSGSTGTPKGVAISHRSLANVVASVGGAIGVTSHDRWFAVSSIAFDIASLELFLPLSIGASCWIAGSSSRDGRELLVEFTDARPTIAQMTPSGWRAILEQGWTGQPGLKALCGGEALPLPLARELVNRTGAAWNVYGPTETTIWSTMQPLTADLDAVSIGHPIANTQLFVLGTRGEPLPSGAIGELAIGGTGVAVGYLNRAAATAAGFVPDPSATRPGARMYVTGDLVRRRSNGALEFVGRKDHQVKVRGYRIELGEIEAVLQRQPDVRAAAVVCRDRPGDTRDPWIVAYLVPASLPPTADRRAASSALRDALEAELPDYMIPGRFVWLAELPTNASGKLDRRALPAPDADVVEAPVAPRTPTEAALAAVWCDVLRRAAVSVTDHFFELGGHSLAAMQVASRLPRALGIDVPLSLLLDRPILAELAAAIDQIEPVDAAAAALGGSQSF